MPNFTNVTLQCLVLVYSLCLLAYSGFACAMVDGILLVRTEATRGERSPNIQIAPNYSALAHILD